MTPATSVSATVSPPSRSLNFRVGTVVAFAAVNLLLVTACVVALWQNLKLRGALAYDVALLTPARDSVVPPLIGVDWVGNPQTVAYGLDRRPTLVYDFTKKCRYCRETGAPCDLFKS